MKHLIALLPAATLAVLLITAISFAEDRTQQQVLDAMGPYAGPTEPGVDASTLCGKVMCGYQGWFAAQGDGHGRGWIHYGRGGRFKPGRCSIDLWPDLSEFDDDEKFATAFRHADGRVAQVFSSLNRNTVLRHFKWMQQFGIDGVFVQRFTPRPDGLGHLHHANTVLTHCREGANRHGRTYAVMYDMHFDAPAIEHFMIDWKRLVDRMQITSDRAYLKHECRPVIALWGIGFTHRRFDAQATKALMEFLTANPKYGGLTVMLGVPAGWRTLKHDCLDDPAVHEVLQMAHVISPWNVGRFGEMEDLPSHVETRWKPDMAWCTEHGKDYMPVVFPGFSWHNMQPHHRLDRIPRHKGQFLWRQYVEAKNVGATMIYQAMFDEIDEGTAIFKCTNDPPVGENPFLTYEGLPSDHYLWLAGMGGQLIRGRIEPTELVPPRDGREVFPAVRVDAAGLDEGLGQVVTEELVGLFGTMFINPVEVCEADERSDMILGTPGGNPRIKQALEQGAIRLPQGKNADQGFAIKTVDGVIYLAAETQQGVLYGLYELLESYGAYFQISNERLPAKREFKIQPLDLCKAPVFKYRGLLPWDNFLCGMSGYNLEDYQRLIGRAVRMKFNMLQFHFYPGIAYYTEQWHGQRVDPAWCANPTIEFPTAESIGQQAFGELEIFGTQEYINHQGDPRAQAEACQELMRQVIDYAQARGMATVVGFSLMQPVGGDPILTDKGGDMAQGGINQLDPLQPHNVELSLQRYRTLVETYPKSDYYWMWQHEGGGPMCRKVGREPGAAEMRQKYAHWSRPDAEGDIDYAYLFREVANRLTPEERSRLATGGWDIQHLFPGIDADYPREPIFASLNAAYMNHSLKEMPGYRVTAGGRRAWMIDWWEFDGNQWFPQFRVSWQEQMYRQCAQFGVEGVTLLGWKLSGVEHNLRYLADFAWNAELTAERFYEDYVRRLYGEKAVPEVVEVFRHYDQLEMTLPSATPADYRPMLLGAGWMPLPMPDLPGTAEELGTDAWKGTVERAGILLQQQRQLLDTDQQAVQRLKEIYEQLDGRGRRGLRLMINRIEFRQLYLESMLALNQAFITFDQVGRESGIDQARTAAAEHVRQSLDLARAAIEEYARDVRNRGDLGVVAQLNKQYHEAIKQLLTAIEQ